MHPGIDGGEFQTAPTRIGDDVGQHFDEVRAVAMQQYDLAARQRMFVEPIANLLGRLAGEVLGVVIPKHYGVHRSPRVRELANRKLSEGRPEQPGRPAHQFFEQTACLYGLLEELSGRHLLGRKMAERMVGDCMSLGGDAAHQMRVGGGIFSEQEKSGPYGVRSQHVENAWRISPAGPVIEGKTNLAATRRSRHHERPPWQNGGHASPRPLAPHLTQ